MTGSLSGGLDRPGRCLRPRTSSRHFSENLATNMGTFRDSAPWPVMLRQLERPVVPSCFRIALPVHVRAAPARPATRFPPLPCLLIRRRSGANFAHSYAGIDYIIQLLGACICLLALTLLLWSAHRAIDDVIGGSCARGKVAHDRCWQHFRAKSPANGTDDRGTPGTRGQD